jgi:hypothetical protein
MRRARLLRFANTPVISVATPHATHTIYQNTLSMTATPPGLVRGRTLE